MKRNKLLTIFALLICLCITSALVVSADTGMFENGTNIPDSEINDRSVPDSPTETANQDDLPDSDMTVPDTLLPNLNETDSMPSSTDNNNKNDNKNDGDKTADVADGTKTGSIVGIIIAIIIAVAIVILIIVMIPKDNGKKDRK